MNPEPSRAEIEFEIENVDIAEFLRQPPITTTNPNTSIKHKRKYHYNSAWQYAELNKAYNADRNMPLHQKKLLALRLDMDPRRVYTWFRQKKKYQKSKHFAKN